MSKKPLNQPPQTNNKGRKSVKKTAPAGSPASKNEGSTSSLKSKAYLLALEAVQDMKGKKMH